MVWFVVCAVEEGEGDEVLVSGWGEVDDFGMEQLKDWQEVLDKWDGKEPQRPSRLVKLCRKVHTLYSTVYIIMCILLHTLCSCTLLTLFCIVYVHVVPCTVCVKIYAHVCTW